jgi:molybdenum cofactor cytidylyltransferase
MRFGRVSVDDAVGAVCAHTVRTGGVILKKGSVVTAETVVRLREAGVSTLAAAQLEPGDVGEDDAALRLAQALVGENVAHAEPFTGRCNLRTKRAGVLLVDKTALDRINAVDEAITAATLPACSPVRVGGMVATVKIIPFAVPGAALDEALQLAGTAGAVRVAAYARRQVGVVSTLLPGLKPSVVAKTLAVLEARLEPTGATVMLERRAAHDGEALARELADIAASEAELIIVFGASAIADRRDVIPAAIERAGGQVEHFGMPVDPGNLLLVGRLAGKPVIGAPGCARSPKENGFDWLLHRLLANVPVTRADITGLGVGGLLTEIVSRPQPREGGASEDET